MTLRLVLVSLVAALGITVPGAPMIESWVASTQNWMNARFADWDTRNPEVADYVIVSDYYDVDRLGPRPEISASPAAPEPSDRPGPPKALSVASTSKPASLPNTPTFTVRPVSIVRQARSFQPIWVGEDFGLGIVMELNRIKQGRCELAPPVVRKPAAPVHFDVLPLATTVYQSLRLEMIQWNKTLASAIPIVFFLKSSPRRSEPLVLAKISADSSSKKLVQLGQGIGINPTAAALPKPAAAPAPKPAVAAALKPVVAVAPKPTVAAAPKLVVAATPKPIVAPIIGFGTMETSANLYFAGAVSFPAKSVLAAIPSKPVQSPAKAADPRVSSSTTSGSNARDEDLDIEVAGELIPFDDGFGTHAPIRKPSISAATPRFQPLEVSHSYYVGTAYELNSRNDGLRLPVQTIVSTTKTETPASAPTHDLNRAVKLTREAVYAWVNVFTGPALVTVSQSR